MLSFLGVGDVAPTVIKKIQPLFVLVRRFLRLIVAPYQCSACRRLLEKDAILCISCFDQIKPIVSTMLKITDRYEIKVFAISEYKDPLRSLVLAKSRANQLACRQLGKLMWQMTDIQHVHFDYIIPIPLHWTRYAQRGFNQAEEMALQLSKLSGKPISQPLTRVKKTKFQSMLSFEKRPENLSQAFKCIEPNDTTYHGKIIVIIDDVLTSGATIKEAVRELRKLKPAGIIALVACRVI